MSSVRPRSPASRLARRRKCRADSFHRGGGAVEPRIARPHMPAVVWTPDANRKVAGFFVEGQPAELGDSIIQGWVKSDGQLWSWEDVREVIASNRMRFSVWQKSHRFRSVLALLSAVALTTTGIFWVRSFWARDEINIYLTHENAMLASGNGAVFFLTVTNYPVAGKWCWRGYHGEPDHPWNLAEAWGPTTCWYRYPASDYREPLFEYAQGDWNNFLTGGQPTPMRYTAARLPHWALATFFALAAACAGLRRSARHKARDTSGAFPVTTEGTQ